jgi:hypothetical protein
MLFELQAELHARVEEARDRLERDRDRLRLTGELQDDAEAIGVNFEIPELVLEHDRHLIGITRAQMFRDDYPLTVRAERDVEMMLARQAARTRRFLKRGADDATQRVLHQLFVPDHVVGHVAPPSAPG